jgi:hypothetical protein
MSSGTSLMIPSNAMNRMTKPLRPYPSQTAALPPEGMPYLLVDPMALSTATVAFSP